MFTCYYVGMSITETYAHHFKLFPLGATSSWCDVQVVTK